ncbi:MAG: homoserine kinase [Planctomycetota bacterium]|nr:homoserine kinase [Planctomycetota bacterium]
MSTLTVRVPASTSNLGPGFDLIGLALSLFLEVSARPTGRAGPHRIERAEGEAADWPSEENRLLVAFDLARGALGANALGANKDRHEAFAFTVRSEIPIARGLGASASATAAGLLLGSAASGAPLGPDELLALGIELEGHPDNIAPTLLGGCRLCLPDSPTTPAESKPPLVVHQAIHPSLAFALAWPEHRIATKQARAGLPLAVPFADAVENPRRLAILLEGLRSGDPELLAAGGEDRLHVARRLERIPGGAEAIAAARRSGAFLATVSGSGSALVAIASPDAAGAAAEAMAGALRAASGTGTGMVADLVEEPPRVQGGA